jgi:hypothetical protein
MDMLAMFAVYIGFRVKELIQRERPSQLVQRSSMPYCGMLERCLHNSIACCQDLHLSCVRFDMSVLLWSEAELMIEY